MTSAGDSLMLIGGELTAAADDTWLDSVSPASEEVIGRVPAAGAADIDRAVRAALEAQRAWSELSIFERGGYLRRLATAIRDRAEQIIRLEALDTGNTIANLGGDVAIAAAYLEYFAGLATEMKGETVPASPANLHFTLRQPYGVVARIVPFNHPFMFAAAHLAAPLTAGNAVVVKTPDTSPLSGGLLAECCREILPPGVVNVVSGLGFPAGDALVRHPRVPRIGFTGSVNTGLAIQRAAAEVAVKHVTLELGGKNPLIVFPDADVNVVVEAAIAGMNFAWAGQSCGSTSRLLVHDSLYASVVEGVAKRMEGLRIGDPLDKASEMGPVNNRAHHERILAFIDQAQAEGARLVTGGSRPSGAGFAKGYWVEPTLFADVGTDMAIAREEIFGPVLIATSWSTQDDLLHQANDTDLGLTAAIWTNDLKAAMTTARQLEAGYVWINGVAQHYVGAPFGGWKNSGLGVEECLQELLGYTRGKAVHVILD